MFGGKAVDCWTCAILRFVTGTLILVFLYYMPELLKLAKGEPAYFRIEFKKVLFIIMFFAYGLFTSLYSDIEHFTKQKRKLKEDANQPKIPVAGVDYWPNESDWPDSPDKPA